MKSEKELELDRLFWDSLHDGDTLSAERYLNEGADIESKNHAGMPPFRFFAANGNKYFKVSEWLLEKGANIDGVDKDGETALLKIINLRNMLAFNWILTKSPDVEMRNKNGVSPLAAACHINNIEMVKNLLENGANPDSVSKLGGSPLLNAIGSGSLEIVKELMKANADFNIKDIDNNTVFHVLPLCKNNELIDYVVENIKSKVDVNSENIFGTTPILLMSLVAHKKGLEFLLDNGANPNNVSVTYDNVSPLMRMVNFGYVELVEKALLAGAKVNTVDINGLNVQSYLSNLILNTQSPIKDIKAITDLLLTNGLDRISSDSHGNSPITAAIRRYVYASSEEKQEAMEFIKFLIDSGFSVNPTQPKIEEAIQPGEKGYDYNIELKKKDHLAQLVPTPLEMALQERLLDVVDLLLANGADPNFLNVHGKSAIHHLSNVMFNSTESMAIQVMKNQMSQEELNEKMKERIEIIEDEVKQLLDKLIQHGGDINLQDKNGVAPIIEFVNNNRIDLTGYAYLHYGADPLLKDDYDDNAITMALKYDRPVIFKAFVEELEEQGRIGEIKNILNEVILSSPDDSSLRLPFLRSLKLLANRTEWVENKDENGNTPLILAAATSQHDAVSVLIDLGVDVNAKNNEGETALMQSFDREDVQTVNILIKAGANIAIQNNKGQSIINLANNGKKREMLFNMNKLQTKLENEVSEESDDIPATFLNNLSNNKTKAWDKYKTPKKSSFGMK